MVFLIEQVALGLYILAGVGILLTWRRLSAANQDIRATHFELERDLLRFKRANELTRLVLLLEFAVAILGIQRVVAPYLRETTDVGEVFSPITDLPFETPTPGVVVFGQSPIDTSGVRIGEEEVVAVIATAVATPTPVGTLLPNPPAVQGCDTPNASLQVPANGMLVFEPINVIGTANTDNFAFYKFEINGPATFGNFVPVRTYDRPVTETGELGQFVPSFYEPGEYQFQVTVFDSTNMMRAACLVNITISEPILTPTPLQQK
ncbi:MAG TPA: hypothetical protein VHO69_06625 [Phototrophicaceae bacterium]|nr:hypothetical protein [Phototrophicaceae bacterium]